jgi:hypothetical protein
LKPILAAKRPKEGQVSTFTVRGWGRCDAFRTVGLGSSFVLNQNGQYA